MRWIPRLVFATGAAILIAPISVFAADPYEASDPAAAGTQQPDASPAGDMREQVPQGEQQQQEMSHQPGAGEEYVVEQGDTLASIAQEKLGSAGKWQEIAKANDIQDPARIRVGQKLVIPNDTDADQSMRSQH